MKVTDESLNHIDGWSVVTLVSLDISAASYMVYHDQLLNKLNEVWYK